MTYKPALVFDFGGVLLEWNPRHLYRKLFNGDEAAMEKFLCEVDFSTWNTEQDRGRSFAEAVDELSARFPHYAGLIKAYDERWEESISGPIQPVVDTLRELKEKGYALYGLTNWSQEKFALVQHKYAFFNLFETILVSGAVRLIKPDPRIFNLLLEKMKCSPEQCIFIDDSLKNVAAAEALGFIPIHFQSPDQLTNELERKGIL
jgi:2-haloacid dehalogenase